MDGYKVNPKDVKVGDIVILEREHLFYNSVKKSYIGKIINIDFRHYEYTVIGFDGREDIWAMGALLRVANADEKMEFSRVSIRCKEYKKIKKNLLNMIAGND